MQADAAGGSAWTRDAGAIKLIPPALQQKTLGAGKTAPGLDIRQKADGVNALCLTAM